MRITVLAGGVGAGARFLQGLRAAYPDDEITVIGNTADDIWLHGLKVCPDLDTVMYTLGGGIDAERGWGRSDESYGVLDELGAYGFEPLWFTLGDRDLATHLVRTQLLSAGYPLDQVTAALCKRWNPGVTLLPMTNERVETHVVVTAKTAAPPCISSSGGCSTALHLPAHQFSFVGIDAATPAPGVLDAIWQADVVVLPPSNPVVSIGPILAVPGIRDAVRDHPGTGGRGVRHRGGPAREGYGRHLPGHDRGVCRRRLSGRPLRCPRRRRDPRRLGV
jgi:LPPG:FO 2-phospho-L-lactate transferase